MQKAAAPCVPSPYTVRNLDAAIAHLERVICDDALAIFGRQYWRSRITQVAATPGLSHPQSRRLRALEERLDRASANADDGAANATTRQRESHRSGASLWTAR
jgi:predicted NBD/HSP70 family sugar kinase